MAWIWVLIPLMALLVGGFTEWLKFKAKQQKLGSSTHELERDLADLRAELGTTAQDRDALLRRVQNLETIVTSQMWDVLHDDGLAGAEKTRALEAARPVLSLPEDEPADADKVAKLARRLKT